MHALSFDKREIHSSNLPKIRL